MSSVNDHSICGLVYYFSVNVDMKRIPNRRNKEKRNMELLAEELRQQKLKLSLDTTPFYGG
jgi:hypothetical protein